MVKSHFNLLFHSMSEEQIYILFLTVIFIACFVHKQQGEILFITFSHA